MTSIEEKLRMLGKKLHGKDGWPVIVKGSGAWEAWYSWRFQSDLSVRYWQTLDRVTVPTEFPPDDLDEALQQAGAGQLSERLAR